MDVRTFAIAILSLVVLAACERSGDSPATKPPAAETAPATNPVPAGISSLFVNKVWSVAESRQVEIGSLRVFLSDGTLVMASPNSTPAFGTWSRDGEGLTITEEGLRYDTDILELTDNSFRIRMHSPGEPVEIRFEPAKQEAPAKAEATSSAQAEAPVWTELSSGAAIASPLHLSGTIRHIDLEGGLFVIRIADGTQYNPLNLPDEFKVDGLAIDAEARRRDDTMSIGMVGTIVELLRIRKRPGLVAVPTAPLSADAEPAAPTPSALEGTAWRLEDLAGKVVLDTSQVTLQFSADGRASGSGSCNNYNGVVTVDGDAIRFGGIAATQMACSDAVMNQEGAYFAALEVADRFEIAGESLLIHTTGGSAPLRFIAAEATPERPGKSIAPMSGTLPALTGLWTVVGHHIPGTSALTHEQARSRYGRTLRLTASTATSADERCREPHYATSRVPADSWLASEYDLPRGSLKPLAGRAQIEVMKASCAGTPWTAFGGVLLGIDRDRALAPRDGVFFELARDRDFHAVGQEPGWQLDIRKGAEMRLTYDYGKGMAVTPVPAPQVDADGGTRIFHASTGANDLRVVIVPVRCNDSMSGKLFAATVTITLNGRTFRGCGEDLATPYEG